MQGTEHGRAFTGLLFTHSCLSPETLIDDSTEDVPSQQTHDNYLSNSDRTADAERVDSYYEDLLARVYASAHRASGTFYSSNDTESIMRHRGHDDLPIWRIKCRVSKQYIEYLEVILKQFPKDWGGGNTSCSFIRHCANRTWITIGFHPGVYKRICLSRMQHKRLSPPTAW